MGSVHRPTVVLCSAPGTLPWLDSRLRAAGVRLVRVAALDRLPVAPARWLPQLARAPAPDTVVVTSRAAVDWGVKAWRAARGPFSTRLEFWAAGPGTATALRRAGARRVRRPSAVERADRRPAPSPDADADAGLAPT